MKSEAKIAGYKDYMNAGRTCTLEEMKAFPGNFYQNRRLYWSGWRKARSEIVKKYMATLENNKISLSYIPRIVTMLWQKGVGWEYIKKETVHEFDFVVGKSLIDLHETFGIPFERPKKPARQPKPMAHQTKLLVVNYLLDRLPNKYAEDALVLMRKFFNAEPKEKRLGCYDERGVFREFHLSTIQKIFDTDEPQFPCTFQSIGATETFTVDWHEVQY